MTKEESTAQGMQAIGQACQASLDQAFDNGVASVVPASPGGVSSEQEKADIDAAVAAAVLPLQDQISALNLSKQKEDALLQSVEDAASKLAALFTPPAQA